MLATSAVVGAVTSATVAESLVDIVVTSEAAASPVCADDALSSMAGVEDSRNAVPLMASSIVVVTSDTAAPGTVDAEVSGVKGEGDRESVLLSADAGKSSAGAVTSYGRDGAPVASLASLAVTVVAALSGVVTASAPAAASVVSVTFVSTDTLTSGGAADVTSATSLITTTFDDAPSLAVASVEGGAALVVVLSPGGVELVGTGGWSPSAEAWSGAAVEGTEARQHDVSKKMMLSTLPTILTYRMLNIFHTSELHVSKNISCVS